MEPAASAAARAARTYLGYLALGHEVIAGPGGRVVRAPAAPHIYDANHLQQVRAETPKEVDELLAFADRALGGVAHRHVLVDPETPPGLVARLALAGHTAKPTLQMLLEGPLAGPEPSAAIAIDPVRDEAGWRTLRALLREDHEEDCARRGRPPYPEEVTDEMVAVKRSKPGLRFWLASADGEPAGFFSSWPGEAGVGMVEDLFTRPALRGRGVARALIHRAVADARARGAREVLIGADPGDTPKHLYARLGFRPVCLTWSWLRAPEGR